MRPIESRQVQAPALELACDATPAEVADAQGALNVLFGASRLTVNGQLDQPTRAAVSDFQRANGLPVSGCLDESTQAALSRAAREVDEDAAPPMAERPAPADSTCEAATAVAPRAARPRADTRVNIEFRTFAPFRDFGGGFDGDNRSFSADPNASSRLSTRVQVDTRASSARIHHASSGTTHPYRGSAMATGHGTAEIRALRPGVSMMTFTQFGQNPLIPSAISPNIDRHATVVLDETTPGHLRLQVSAEGDTFPNCEMSITDISGQSLFLDGYATRFGEHGPISLYGDDHAPLFARDVDVLVDARGRFTGVQFPSGEVVSLSEWNRRVLRAERDDAHRTDAGRGWR